VQYGIFRCGKRTPHECVIKLIFETCNKATAFRGLRCSISIYIKNNTILRFRIPFILHTRLINTTENIRSINILLILSNSAQTPNPNTILITCCHHFQRSWKAEQRDIVYYSFKKYPPSKMIRYDEWIYSVLLLIAGIYYSQAFIISSPATSRTSIIGAIVNDNDRILTRLSLLNNDEDKETDNINDDSNDDEEKEEESRSIGLPALGPAGTSSRDNNDDGTTTLTLNAANTTTATATIDGSNNNKNASFVSSKFSLQYTCNVCEHRNRVIVSRMAYREG
jgi:hypothetical protein